MSSNERDAKAKPNDDKYHLADLLREPEDPHSRFEHAPATDTAISELCSGGNLILINREMAAWVRAAIDGISPKLQPIMRAHYELSIERAHPVFGA